MKKSLNERRCFFCGETAFLERHHIFGGADRKKSEKYGLCVYLCHRHHNEPPDGVHFNRERMDYLRRYGQQMAMLMNAWTVEDFIREFGRNYLEEDTP